jgi:cyclophilin family peptidyl-prolyl cis-trans isomerase
VFKRLLSRRHRTASLESPRPARPAVENLESRTLLHSPTITAVSADNRGEVFITFDQAAWAEIDTTKVNKNSVQMYEAGPDGHLGNADDVRVAASIRYTPSNGRILVRGPVAAGHGYRVKLVGSRLTTTTGDPLDGEFNGAFPSGNGVAGGNFEFQVKNDKSTTPTVRMSTNEGTINLKMRADVAPKSVKNFMAYANSLRYDNIFFTRDVPDFIIQGGSLQINGSNQVVDTALDPKVQNEFNISNTRGTVAMAKQGGDPNSATNQFFFNLGDNSSNLDTQNGGFTVFAQVKDNASLTVMDNIAGKQVVALHNDVTGHGVLPSHPATGLTNTPVNNKNLMTGATETINQQSGEQGFVVTGGFNAARDLIVIRRVAQLSKVAAL